MDTPRCIVRQSCAKLSGVKFDLRQARIDKGQTLAEASDEIGVGITVLLRAEKGAFPRPGNALRIADYYGVKPSQVWSLDKAGE